MLVFITFLLLIATASLIESRVAENPALKPIIRSRIVGGRETVIEEFPFQVSILQQRSHICGGSIYKSDIVITAAHCFKDVHVGELAVVAGATDWEVGGIETVVKSYVTHPRYVAKTFDYDIAIVHLAEKLKYGPTIQPIQLPYYRQEFTPGSVGVVSGWGSLYENGQDPDMLHYTALNVLSNYACYKAYREIHPVNKNMICAGVRNGGKGTCQGDSGSALVIGNVLAGIVSWGLGCARPDAPDVFTKVSIFRRWIDMHLESLA